jgi:hypothetical protein
MISIPKPEKKVVISGIRTRDTTDQNDTRNSHHAVGSVREINKITLQAGFECIR